MQPHHRQGNDCLEPTTGQTLITGIIERNERKVDFLRDILGGRLLLLEQVYTGTALFMYTIIVPTFLSGSCHKIY